MFRAMLAGTPRPLVAAAALTLAAALSACGSSAGQRVIAHVGDATITAPAIEHWTTVMAPTGAARPRGRKRRELEHTAVQRLIDDDWLTSEAAALGRPVSGADVDRGLEQSYGSPEGKAQYRLLITIGHYTPADVRQEVQARLAAHAIAGYVSAYSQAIPGGRVRSYYRSHLAEFHLQERRIIQEVGELPGPVPTKHILEEVRHGVPFSKLSIVYVLERTNFSVIPLEKRIMFLAAFRAKPHELVGPLDINGYEFLFEVTRIEAPRTLSLAEASATIVSRLSDARHARLLSSVMGRLTAMTSCAPGYVVQGCRQYRGPRAPGSVLETPPPGLLEPTAATG